MTTPAARSYVVGLPAIVTVYPDGHVTIAVDTTEAGDAILDSDGLDTTTAVQQALTDRMLVDAAHDAQSITVTADWGSK